MIMVKGSPVNWKGGKAQQKTGGRKKKEEEEGEMKKISNAEERGRGIGLENRNKENQKNIYLLN